MQPPKPERVSFVAARRRLAGLLGRVCYGHERIVLTRHGRAVAAVVPLRDLGRLEDLEAEATHAPSQRGTVPIGEAIARRMEEELRAMP